MKILSKLRKKIYKSLLIFCLLTRLSYSNYCEQVITVNYKPFNGVKVYNITGGTNDKRGIIDLGHFNGVDSNKVLNMGKVTVSIELINNASGNDREEIEIIMLDKLKNYSWNYSYDITSFIGANNDVSTKIKVDNLTILEGNESGDNTVLLVCLGDEEENHDHKKLKYSFDLILELNNLQTSAMYGVSPKKDSGTNAYVNIKDIVLDQLRGSKIGF